MNTDRFEGSRKSLAGKAFAQAGDATDADFTAVGAERDVRPV